MQQEKSACFTGQCPESFCSDSREFKKLEPKLKMLLKRETLQAVQQGYTTFYCGMARGVDILAGETVLSLKADFPEIQLICVIPFPRQPYYWADSWISRYNYLYDHSKRVLISPAYSPDCYHRRNRYMVDHSDLVIAVMAQETERGGTASTIRYARKKNKPVISLLYNNEIFIR